MNDGSLSDTVEEMLDCVGYSKPEGPTYINEMLLVWLEDNGGCSSCISMLRRAT